MKNKWNIILLITLIITGCGNLDVYEENQAIISASWPDDKIFRFEFHSTDTIAPKDIYINLRHTNLYKYNNIFLFVTTIAPNGRSLKDTSEFTIAKTNGKWLGSGLGGIFEVRLAYKHNVRFAQEGKYIFYVQHGMRERSLKDIIDVGIRIENVK